MQGSWIPITPSKVSVPQRISSNLPSNQEFGTEWKEKGKLLNEEFSQTVFTPTVDQTKNLDNLELDSSHIANSQILAFSNGEIGWSRITYADLLAVASMGSSTATQRGSIFGSSSFSPYPISKVSGDFLQANRSNGSSFFSYPVSEGSENLLNHTTCSHNLWNDSNFQPQMQGHYGFPLPYDRTFDLDTETKTLASAATNGTITFQMAPVTPDQGKKMKVRQISSVLHLDDAVVSQEKRQKSATVTSWKERKQHQGVTQEGLIAIEVDNIFGSSSELDSSHKFHSVPFENDDSPSHSIHKRTNTWSSSNHILTSKTGIQENHFSLLSSMNSTPLVNSDQHICSSISIPSTMHDNEKSSDFLTTIPSKVGSSNPIPRSALQNDSHKSFESSHLIPSISLYHKNERSKDSSKSLPSTQLQNINQSFLIFSTPCTPLGDDNRRLLHFSNPDNATPLENNGSPKLSNIAIMLDQLKDKNLLSSSITEMLSEPPKESNTLNSSITCPLSSNTLDSSITDPINSICRNAIDSTTALLSNPSQNSDNASIGENPSIDNITTPQKPKRKKHRPKVVREGKPKTSPLKPVTPKQSNTETPRVKRKYVRKNDMRVEKTTPKGVTANFLDRDRKNTKSCRRSLNFDSGVQGEANTCSETHRVISSLEASSPSNSECQPQLGCTGIDTTGEPPFIYSRRDEIDLNQSIGHMTNEGILLKDNPCPSPHVTRQELSFQNLESNDRNSFLHYTERSVLPNCPHRNGEDWHNKYNDLSYVMSREEVSRKRSGDHDPPTIHGQLHLQNTNQRHLHELPCTDGYRYLNVIDDQHQHHRDYCKKNKIDMTFDDLSPNSQSATQLLLHQICKTQSHCSVESFPYTETTRYVTNGESIIHHHESRDSSLKKTYSSITSSQKTKNNSHIQSVNILQTSQSKIKKSISSTHRRKKDAISRWASSVTVSSQLMDEHVDRIEVIVERMKHLDINSHFESALIPYNGNRGMVPYGGGVIQRRRPRAKVDLDPDTNRVWNLLMGKEVSHGYEGTDDDKKKWWEEERKVFRGRAESFIARMHLIQGDRRFSQWKGSVVDSVVGVFLTQNVSDHLSSSAFMSLASRFPLMPEKKPDLGDREIVNISTPKCSYLAPEIISHQNENLKLYQAGSTNEGDHKESDVTNTDESFGSNIGEGLTECIVDQNLSSSKSRVRELKDLNLEFENVVSSQDSAVSLQDSFCIQMATHILSSSDSNSEPDVAITEYKLNGKDCSAVSTELLPIPFGEETNRNLRNGLKVVEPTRNVPTSSRSLSILPDTNTGSSISSYSHAPCANPEIELTVVEHEGSTEGSRTLDDVSDVTEISYVEKSPRTSFRVIKSFESSVLHNPLSRYTHTILGDTSISVSPILTPSTLGEKTTDKHCLQKCSPNNLMSTFSNLENKNESKTRLNNTSEPSILQTPIKHSKQHEVQLKLASCSGETSDILEPSGLLKNSEQMENKVAETNLRKSKYLASRAPSGATPKAKKGMGEGMQSFDWDALRKQTCPEDVKKGRSKETLDSVDWEAVRCAKVEEIADTIKERGMNHMLAERIKGFLNRLVQEHGSIDLEWLREIPPDKTKDYLLSIRGLGLKSVECVRLLTLHHLAFPVDTNVGRIAVRLGWVPLQPLPESLQLHLLELYPMLETIQKYLWPRLCTLDQQTLYELHYQLITFGKVFCTKRDPNCNACPMRGECKHFASAFASARFALPAPEEKSIISSHALITTKNAPNFTETTLSLPSIEISLDSKSEINKCEPIIEEPMTPEQESIETSETAIEDAFNDDDPNEIPIIRLDIEEFTTHIKNYIQENNLELQDVDMSKALVALAPEHASIPMPKLKNMSRLRTEHQVYELPDSHPLLKEWDKREPDDPCPYLLSIWTPGETAESIQPPERTCNSEDSGNLCTKDTCFQCNTIKEANTQTVRGTILVPCRTAMRGSFPLNGTYFQVNEVFADHDSSIQPIDVPRKWIWNLPRRTVYFGTSVTTIFRGLSTEEIQHCFWRGLVCVRGFDRKTRGPRPLMTRLHFPASKIIRGKKVVSFKEE